MDVTSIPPSRILSQDPEEMQKPMRFHGKVLAEFEIKAE